MAFRTRQLDLLSVGAGGTPAGAIDGINTTYTLSHTPVQGTVFVILNNLVLTEGIDYTVDYVNNQIIMTTPINPNDYPPNFPFVVRYSTYSSIPSGNVQFSSAFSSAFQ